MLNYIVTSNHTHLLVKDTGANGIAESMQLIAGRTAQEYNERKARHGAFGKSYPLVRSDTWQRFSHVDHFAIAKMQD